MPSLVRTDVPPLLSIDSDADVMSGIGEQSVSDSSEATYPSTLRVPIGLQHSGSMISADNEPTKSVTSGITKPLEITNSTSTGYKMTVPSTSLSGPIQVIDTTSSHDSSDNHQNNNIGIGTNSSSISISSTESMHMPKKNVKNCVVGVLDGNERTKEFAPTFMARNVSSTTPTKGY